MQKALYYTFGAAATVTGIYFIYLFTTGQFSSLLVGIGFECAASTVLFIMLEPRPTKTEAQVKHHNKVLGQGVSILLMLVVAAVVIMFASSCSTTKDGYGCHGRSRCMTRVQ
jgi:hypothetical protein